MAVCRGITSYPKHPGFSYHTHRYFSEIIHCTQRSQIVRVLPTHLTDLGLREEVEVGAKVLEAAALGPEQVEVVQQEGDGGGCRVSE